MFSFHIWEALAENAEEAGMPTLDHTRLLDPYRLDLPGDGSARACEGGSGTVVNCLPVLGFMHNDAQKKKA